MPSFKSLVVASAAIVTMACAQEPLNETIYGYIAPTETASRSPCPGLNALANHGLLPRDGKNIDMEALIVATYLGYSLNEVATRVVGTVGLQASTTGNASTFNLEDLNTHQIIEHDGSMTRDDAYFGDSLTFSQAAYARTLASWGDAEILTFELASAERKARFAYGVANNPQFNQTFASSGSLLEYSLALSAFGNITTGNANLTMIKYLFENERLPTALGWQRPSENITITSAQAMSARIAAGA